MKASRYGELYCGQVMFGCTIVQSQVIEKTVTKGKKTRVIKKKVTPKWEDLWPVESERDAVRRINRTNGSLQAGMKVAFPMEISGRNYLDFSPLPPRIEAPGERLIVVELGLLAFGAYEADGTLVRWGPISGGKGGWGTPAGSYRIKTRRGQYYRSGKYPEGCGEEGGGACAPMPYAMHFRPGYALHGGYLPGRHASRGCVRMYTEDAKWLNHEFVKIGTAVLIRPYPGGSPYKFYPPSPDLAGGGLSPGPVAPPLKGDQPDGTTHGSLAPSTATGPENWTQHELILGPAWESFSWGIENRENERSDGLVAGPRRSWIDRIQVARRPATNQLDTPLTPVNLP